MSPINSSTQKLHGIVHGQNYVRHRRYDELGSKLQEETKRPIKTEKNNYFKIEAPRFLDLTKTPNQAGAGPES
jgi:hypothetical protein